MTNEYVLGVDVGGTKIAVGSMDLAGKVMHSVSIPSAADSERDLWDRLSTAAGQVIATTAGQLVGIGIGSAGPIDVEHGTVSPVNISVWRDFPLVASLRAAFDCDRVLMHGDAIALTNAEYRFGAGKGSRSMVGMVVSTGIGGGLVIDGELRPGASGNAGYFGHSTIVMDGEECPCGRRGCVEVYASGPHMVRKAKQLGWRSDSNDFVELADAARSGDQAAIEAIRLGTDALAVGIINVGVTVDVKLVVIGGGVSRAGDVYWEPLRAAVRRRALGVDFLADLELRPAMLSAEAGLIGAALAAL